MSWKTKTCKFCELIKAKSIYSYKPVHPFIHSCWISPLTLQDMKLEKPQSFSLWKNR